MHGFDVGSIDEPAPVDAAPVVLTTYGMDWDALVHATLRVQQLATFHLQSTHREVRLFAMNHGSHAIHQCGPLVTMAPAKPFDRRNGVSALPCWIFSHHLALHEINTIRYSFPRCPAVALLHRSSTQVRHLRVVPREGGRTAPPHLRDHWPPELTTLVSVCRQGTTDLLGCLTRANRAIAGLRLARVVLLGAFKGCA